MSKIFPKFKYGESQKVSSTDIDNGSLLFDIEKRTFYVDLEDNRYEIGHIVFVSELPSINSALQKIYFNEEDHSLYYPYNGNWIPLGGSDNNDPVSCDVLVGRTAQEMSSYLSSTNATKAVIYIGENGTVNPNIPSETIVFNGSKTQNDDEDWGGDWTIEFTPTNSTTTVSGVNYTVYSGEMMCDNVSRGTYYLYAILFDPGDGEGFTWCISTEIGSRSPLWMARNSDPESTTPIELTPGLSFTDFMISADFDVIISLASHTTITPHPYKSGHIYKIASGTNGYEFIDITPTSTATEEVYPKLTITKPVCENNIFLIVEKALTPNGTYTEIINTKTNATDYQKVKVFNGTTFVDTTAAGIGPMYDNRIVIVDVEGLITLGSYYRYKWVQNVTTSGNQSNSSSDNPSSEPSETPEEPADNSNESNSTSSFPESLTVVGSKSANYEGDVEGDWSIEFTKTNQTHAANGINYPVYSGYLMFGDTRYTDDLFYLYAQYNEFPLDGANCYKWVINQSSISDETWDVWWFALSIDEENGDYIPLDSLNDLSAGTTFENQNAGADWNTCTIYGVSSSGSSNESPSSPSDSNSGESNEEDEDTTVTDWYGGFYPSANEQISNYGDRIQNIEKKLRAFDVEAIVIVSELPNDPDPNTLYLIPETTGE